MWFVYEILLVVAGLAYLPRAVWRRRLPHRGWTMRLGRYPAHVVRRLAGRPSVWIHAVSVGEVQASLPLLRALSEAHPQQPVVLSTITTGGFTVAERQLPANGVPIYGPLDLRGCVRRALALVQPRLLLLVESELWPTLIRLTKARGVPIIVVNGRISSRAHRRYQWVRRWLTPIIRQVDLFLMQTPEDAQRIEQLGAPSAAVRVVGSLKWDASLQARPSAEAIRATASRLGLNGQEPLLVAGSTHRGEELALLAAFQAARRIDPAMRLIIAPRHLERVAEVEELVAAAQLTAVRLSHPSTDGRWDVGIVDTFGELAHYYALATVAFIGGSLIPHGGQNPLEAAVLGKPILFGPSMENFAEIARQLTVHQAARQLADPSHLTAALQEFLTHRSLADAMGRRAQALTERSQGALRRTLEALAPLDFCSSGRFC